MKTFKFLLASAIVLSLSSFAVMPVMAMSGETNAYSENVADEVAEKFVFDENSKTIISYINNENDETLLIPGQINGVTVERLSGTMFNSNSSIKSVVIPSTVVKIGDEGMTDTENSVFATLSQLEEIVVDAENKSYASIDGVLVNTTGELLCYPKAKADEIYTLPAEITSIGKLAFENAYNLKKLCVNGNPIVNIWALGTVCNFNVECMPKTNIEQYCKDNYVNYRLILLSGDVNGDGEITAADSAVAMQLCLDNNLDLGLDSDSKIRADVDADGNITALDCSMILQKSLNSKFGF